MLVNRAKRLMAGHGVTLVDQVFSSASNMLAVVLVARSLTADAFGAFSLAYATLTLCLGLSRAYFGTRISLEKSQEGALQATSRVLGALALLSPVIAIAVFTTSLVLSARVDQMLVLMVAVATPVVCLQDALRFGAAAGGRPVAALASDVTWTVLVALPLVVGARLSAQTALGLWLAAAGLALVTIAIGVRVPLNLRTGFQELRTRHVMGASMAYVSLIGQIATLAVLAVVTRTIGQAGAGALRGASSTMMGPVNVAFAFIALGLTPALARRPNSGLFRICAILGGATSLGVGLWGALLMVIPHSIGEAIMGSSWAGVDAVLPITALEYLALSWSTASTLGLKVERRAGVLRNQRTVMSITVTIIGASAAIWLGTTQAVAAGFAVGAAASAVIGWHSLRDLRQTIQPDFHSPSPGVSRRVG